MTMVKMSFEIPTIGGLLLHGLSVVQRNLETLVLLSLLFGIVATVIFWPAAEVIQAVFQVMLQKNDRSLDTANALLNNGSMAIFSGMLGLLTLMSLIIVPWARQAAPSKLMPLSGGTGDLLHRSWRVAIHLITAGGLCAIAFFALQLVTGLVANAFPALGGIVAVAALIACIWMCLALTCTAYLAATAEAQDRRETLRTAWMRARLFLQPMIGCYAAILFLSGMVNIFLSMLAFNLVPAHVVTLVDSIVNFAVSFACNAFYVAALYKIPDFRDILKKED